LITSLSSAFLTLSLFHRTFTETLHILGRERNRLLFSYIHMLKVIVYKSCGELSSLLLLCGTCTFGPAQSCDFQKLQVYETKL
jgi:hypothetical protein